jgi:broad specificity phosphatase PhoE
MVRFLKRILRRRASGPSADATGLAPGEAAGRDAPAHGSDAPPGSRDEQVTVTIVLSGEHNEGGELTLQGSIQAGLVAGALANETVGGVLACSTAGCRATAERIAEGRESVEVGEFALPDTPAGTRPALADLQQAHAGRSVVLVADERLLHLMLNALDGLSPGEDTPPRVDPGSITRLRLRPDLSYSLRLNDTDHLDEVTNSDRFRML